MFALPRISRSRSLIGLGAIALIALGTASAEVEVYQIDKVHSLAGFKIRHLFSKTAGRFTDFGGTLHFDAAKPEDSRIEITIQAASIDTDNENRDNHLRTADFFDVEKYPTITFMSTKIEPTGEKDRFKVTGDFTMLGVTKPVTISVELLGFAEFPGMGHRGGFSASTTINRKDFGMQWNKVFDAGGTILGEEVEIDFPIEVMRAAS